MKQPHEHKVEISAALFIFMMDARLLCWVFGIVCVHVCAHTRLSDLLVRDCSCMLVFDVYYNVTETEWDLSGSSLLFK